MKHAKMTKEGTRQYYILLAGKAECDADVVYYLKQAGFTESIKLQDLPGIDSNKRREQ